MLERKKKVFSKKKRENEIREREIEKNKKNESVSFSHQRHMMYATALISGSRQQCVDSNSINNHNVKISIV